MKCLDSITVAGIELLKIDRDKLWSDRNLDRHVQLLNAVADSELKLVISRNGKSSIPFFLAWRRGCRKVGDLNLVELNELERYIENKKRLKIRNALLARAGNAQNSFLAEYLVRDQSREIAKLSTKTIRDSRTKFASITELKIGITMSDKECKGWGLRLSKVNSTKHRNILLRVAHGDIYTKAKLNRFGLTADPTCPRCLEIETLDHKFISCPYVKKIWEKALTLTRSLTTSDPLLETPAKAILGCYINSTTTVLTINAEIISRIHLLKDDANYLQHPKHFVRQALIFLLKREKNEDIKDEIKFILDRQDRG